MPFPPSWLMFPTLTSFKPQLFRLMVKLYIYFKMHNILLLYLTIIIQLLFNYAVLDIHSSIILTPSSTSSKYELQKLYLNIQSSFSFLPIFIWYHYVLENCLQGFFQFRSTLQCNSFSLLWSFWMYLYSTLIGEGCFHWV